MLGAQELAEKVEIRTDIPGNVALFRHRADGNCSFLTPARMCGLQARHGPGALATACATFPRTVNQVRGRHEVSGTSSCPEVARLLIGAEDALDPVETGPAPFTDAANEWSSRRAQLRDEALRVLRTRHPFSTRLALLGYLAVEPGALANEEVIARNLAALDVPSGHWLTVAEELLTTRARASSVGRLDALLARMEPLDWGGFVARRERYAAIHPWAEGAFERLAQNAWLRGAGLDGGTAEAVSTFVLRLGLLRIAWVRQELPPDRGGAEARLVETAQILSKYVDASAELLSFRDELCQRPPADLFGFLLTLAKLQP